MNPKSTDHYSLTKKQQTILNLLYRFRFATSDHLSKALNITKATTNKRLQLMLQLNYIGRRYTPEDKISRHHAIYFLLEPGIIELKKISKEKYLTKVLRNIRNDVNASAEFARHSLNVFDAYNQLRTTSHNNLQFFTKTQLAAKSYFPKQLPDAHIQLGEEPELFLLDVLHKDQPFFKATRAIIRYIDYVNEDKWPSQHQFPKLLIICDDLSLQKRLTKKMQRRIENLENSDLKLYITNLKELKNDAWHDMAEPDNTLPLSQI